MPNCMRTWLFSKSASNVTGLNPNLVTSVKSDGIQDSGDHHAELTSKSASGGESGDLAQALSAPANMTGMVASFTLDNPDPQRATMYDDIKARRDRKQHQPHDPDVDSAMQQTANEASLALLEETVSSW
eukprot:COSAG01_NODE_26482_length_712_cov_5.727569_2_plen_128_part_01